MISMEVLNNVMHVVYDFVFHYENNYLTTRVVVYFSLNNLSLSS